jgi:hypothetical protein
MSPRAKKPAGNRSTKRARLSERKYIMAESDEVFAKAMAEANSVFERMRGVVEEATASGVTQLDVVDVAQKSGLEIDEKTLDELQVDRIIHIQPWLPWYYWWPWRPFWCWWWHRYYPIFHYCCPWWWNRCHWYPYPL